MNVFLIDPTASFLDFALRAEAQGHDVRVFMGPDKRGDRTPVGDGLLHKIDDIQKGARWADLILASDNAKYVRDLQGLHDRGFPVFAPNAECTTWELDRSKGQKVLMDAGIECLPCIEFTNYEVAKAHQLANKDKRYVSKPSADVDKALSYVSKSFKDMCFMLDYWKKHNNKKVPFIFQEFCPGIEMAVGGWMGRDGFLGHVLENFEFKKLMPGEKGPNTGEMGTVMKYCTWSESKLAQEMLAPLESRLIRCGYTGFIDVAVMIGTDGERKGKVNPLEFTTRHGWPLFQIQQALHPDICNWMHDALHGKDTFTPYTDVACGIVCAMPDFPYSHFTRKEVTGFPVWGINTSNRFNFHPCEMMLGESYGDSGRMEPMLVTAGDYVAVVTGTGSTVGKAKDKAYANLNEFEIPNSPIFRNDIGNRLEKQLPELQKYGYATAWEF
jgi:phosphoribosylamine---glycine ligase